MRGPRPGSSTGAVVSSMNSLSDFLMSSAIRATIGVRSRETRPTQAARTQRSRMTPLRIKRRHCLYIAGTGVVDGNLRTATFEGRQPIFDALASGR